jgi:hypothetical protein
MCETWIKIEKSKVTLNTRQERLLRENYGSLTEQELRELHEIPVLLADINRLKTENLC